MIDNAIDDPVDTPRILETAHRPDPAANFSKSALYCIGSSNLAPMGFRTVEEAQ